MPLYPNKTMQIILPEIEGNLDGPTITVDRNDTQVCDILAERGNFVILDLTIQFYPKEPKWYDKAYYLYGQWAKGRKMDIQVIREITTEEFNRFRVPRWIQGDEVPTCCRKPMYFVGQLEDSLLCDEEPPKAKYWWHDHAAFYVFTCGQCLGVKAVGQQC
jgi:hypothetical protein